MSEIESKAFLASMAILIFLFVWGIVEIELAYRKSEKYFNDLEKHI